MTSAAGLQSRVEREAKHPPCISGHRPPTTPSSLTEKAQHRFHLGRQLQNERTVRNSETGGVSCAPILWLARAVNVVRPVPLSPPH